MHISHKHKFVYVGIPRTGSRSMFQWLSDNYESENLGGHHDCDVPEEFQDYLIFTTVRNPYERLISGWYYGPAPKDPREHPELFPEDMRRAQREIEENPQRPHQWTQKRYVEHASVSLVLYHECLPQCLGELPFVDPENIPPFPRWNASSRPAGCSFLDLFSTSDEQLAWDRYAEDFEFFRYRRFDCGRPEGSNMSMHLTGGSRPL